MSKFQINFKLKQHTPLIHFQHDQAGATLRATELKPKLDKFILAKVGDGDKDAGYIKAKEKGWLVGNGEHRALDYKVKIIAKKSVDKNMKANPLYFGNMGNTPPKYHVSAVGEVSVVIFCFYEELKKTIDSAIADFFALNNFGTRQGKGIGSFYPTDIKKYPFPESSFDYSFRINTYDFQLSRNRPSIFQIIDLFYKSIRSGINRKRPHKDRNGKQQYDNDGMPIFIDVFYFKSLLFLYFKSQNIQWEKKTIKEEFFLDNKTRSDWQTKKEQLVYKGLTRQQEDRVEETIPVQDFPLSYDNNNQKLVKALLGLSSEEEWKSYNRNKISIQDRDGAIDRFKSPIFFKIIKRPPTSYDVYIKLAEHIPLLGKWFDITASKKDGNLRLQVPSDFSLHQYFDFFMNPENFQIDTHVQNDYREFHRTDEYAILENIFANLQKINE